MMINSEKLMGRMSSKGTVLSEKSISNVGVIRRRLVDIDGMLKDKLVLDLDPPTVSLTPINKDSALSDAETFRDLKESSIIKANEIHSNSPLK